jgi:hypothetical protein
MLLNINLTDIKSGIRHTVDNCPIGLAFKRLFPGKEITVFSSKVTVRDGNTVVSYYPKDSDFKNFIFRFDSGTQVLPTTFEFYVK